MFSSLGIIITFIRKPALLLSFSIPVSLIEDLKILQNMTNISK